MPDPRIPAHPSLSVDPEICEAYATDASGLSQRPEAVARPESESEVADLLRLCADRRICLTPQGLRSSTTGASVPQSGIVLCLERMNRLIEIDRQRRVAIVEPGMVTAEFKRQVRAAGLFYPPDPTSEDESTLGGNVATDASGSRSYLYGPTRRYVRALRLVLADGTRTEIRSVRTRKNVTGYFGFQNPVDLWIGSEGTLGVVTRIELDLLPAAPDFFGALAFFPDWRAAIRFVLSCDAARREQRLRPRCLELFDRAALRLVAPEAGGMRIPAGAGAAIFFEEELAPEAVAAVPEEMAGALERWLPAIEAAGGLADETFVAQSSEEQEQLRRLRHAIPAGMDERGKQAMPLGGRRVGTDFAVPLERLPELLEESYRILEESFDGSGIIYGHVGSGHPHINMIAEDERALPLAEETARRLTQRALELGGALSGEHGIGKVKAKLFRQFYPAWLVDSMRAVKRSLDPLGILAPGNFFTDAG